MVCACFDILPFFYIQTATVPPLVRGADPLIIKVPPFENAKSMSELHYGCLCGYRFQVIDQKLSIALACKGNEVMIN